MKKILSALAIAAVGAYCCVPSAMAQGEVNFSYATSDEYMEFGTGKAEQYFAAILIDDATLNGKTITGMSVPAVAAEGIVDYAAWISTKLEKKFEADIETVTASPENGVLDVTFAQPYVINGPIYVGYNFTVKEKSPETESPLMVEIQNNPGVCFMKLSRTKLNWFDASTMNIVSPITVKLSGDFKEDNVSLASINKISAKAGEKSTAVINLLNQGCNTVSAIDYTYTIEGMQPVSGTWNFESPLANYYNRPVQVSIELPALDEVKPYDLTVEAVKVNGKDNTSAEKSIAGKIYNMHEVPVHRALLEEYTGTWCGYCVYGYAGMEYMEEHYTDICVPVVFHSGDPMEFNGGIPSYISGFPSGYVDRKYEVYPAYGPTVGETDMYDTVVYQASQDTPLAINVEASYADATSGGINVKVDYTFVNDVEGNPEDYRMHVILVTDDLSGTTSAWTQHNYESGKDLSGYPGMEIFQNGGASIKGLKFNNVAAAFNDFYGEEGSITSLEVNKAQTYTYKFNIYDALNTAGQMIIQNGNNVKVVASLFKVEGDRVRALNSVRCKVTGESGIRNLSANADKAVVETSYFDINGNRVVNPQGLVIKAETYSDGTTTYTKQMIK